MKQFEKDVENLPAPNLNFREFNINAFTGNKSGYAAPPYVWLVQALTDHGLVYPPFLTNAVLRNAKQGGVNEDTIAARVENIYPKMRLFAENALTPQGASLPRKVRIVR